MNNLKTECFMRKIEEAMCAAVKTRKNWQSGNTRVESRRAENGGVEIFVYLHGNKICEVYENLSGCYEKYFSLAGWNTSTTRSRLHALGIGVSSKNFAPMYNGTEIDSYKWYKV